MVADFIFLIRPLPLLVSRFPFRSPRLRSKASRLSGDLAIFLKWFLTNSFLNVDFKQNCQWKSKSFPLRSFVILSSNWSFTSWSMLCTFLTHCWLVFVCFSCLSYSASSQCRERPRFEFDFVSQLAAKLNRDSIRLAERRSDFLLQPWVHHTATTSSGSTLKLVFIWYLHQFTCYATN